MHKQLVFWLSLVVTMISILALFSIVGFELYVRWALNQNFTFLGSNGLAALMLLVGVELFVLAYSQKS